METPERWNRRVYVVRDAQLASARILLDPDTIAPGQDARIEAAVPNWDGSLVAYALARAGSDDYEIRTREVDGGRDLPEILARAAPYVAWDPDGLGFCYVGRRGESAGTSVPLPGAARVLHHRLGDATVRDKVVFETHGSRGWLRIESGEGYGRWLLISGTDEAGTSLWCIDRALIDAAPRRIFAPSSYEDRIVGVINGRLYLASDRDAPRSHVLALDLPRLAAARGDAPFEEIVAESSDTLAGAYLCGGRLALHYLHDGESRLVLTDLDGLIEDRIPLPQGASVSFVQQDEWGAGVLVTCSSFVETATSYRWDPRTGEIRVAWRDESRLDGSCYEVEETLYKSVDGTAIPLLLIRRKGLTRDGDRPVYVYGYGGFGIDVSPQFLPGVTVLLDRSFMIAIPRIRGGRTYGRDWHRSVTGRGRVKSVEDFIAAAEWLVHTGWTRPARLAIGGASNGGLLVAAALVRRPDLFAAAVCETPLTDMLRFDRFGLGAWYTSEFGRPDDPGDAASLLAWSPYHNVRDGVDYPATLVSAAMNDERADAAHARKFVARLQAATAGPRPILLRLERDAGHSSDRTVSKQYSEAADVFTFLLWRLGPASTETEKQR